MKITLVTIFPGFFPPVLAEGLIRVAREKHRLDVEIVNLRDFTDDVHQTVDDSPFGGGAGMVMTPGPLFAAVEAVEPPRPLLLCAAAGRRFDQPMARELAGGSGFSLVCGRYEGVDQRVADHLCDGEVSIGDYVLAGGEAAALVMVEAVARLVPGVMGNEASADQESFAPPPAAAGPGSTGSGSGLLEYPQYTRPADFRGWSVPEVLRSGDHGRIARWRRAQALRRTRTRRPDLLDRPLTAEEHALLAEFPE